MNQLFLQLKSLIQKVKIASGILDRRVYTGPWYVQVDLTNQCNNNCIACWCNSPLLGNQRMDSKTKSKTLPFERVLHLIDELNDMGVQEIHFTGGGEPFMHPRILDIIKHAKNKGLAVGMNTNFTLVDRETARQIVDFRMDHMIISLWAATPETYVELHPNKSKETFKALADTLDYIHQLKLQMGTPFPRIEMYNVINIYNYHELHQMLEFAYRHHMDAITFTPVDTVLGKTDELAVSGGAKRELIKSLENLPHSASVLDKKFPHHEIAIHYDIFHQRIVKSNSVDYDGSFLESMPSCYAGWNFARVLANGDVNSCLKSFKMPVGNILDNRFKDIWLGGLQNRFRRHTIDYDYQDPFFKNMGNDRFADDQGCYKCCDNLEMNLSIHSQISTLGSKTQKMLKVLGRTHNRSEAVRISSKGRMKPDIDREDTGC